MLISDKIAVELVKGLFETVEDIKFVGKTIQRDNRMGEKDMEIDEIIYSKLQSVAERISKRHKVSLRIVSESNILEIGKGEYYYVSLDECDGSVNRNPEFRAVMAGVGLMKTGHGSTKEITSGAIKRFDGKLFYTDNRKALLDSAEIKKPEDLIVDYPQIAVCSHHENH